MQIYDVENIKKKTSIKPLASGGASFETHILNKTDTGYKFKPSTFYAFFCGLFVAVPYGGLIFAIYKFQQTGSFSFLFNNVIATLVFLMFFIVGHYLLILFFSPIVFNTATQTFYKGFNIPILRKKKKIIRFNTIVALQIIGEHVHSDDGSYKSFELNLVLKDTTRVNMIDHGKLKTLIIDAETLSHYLKVPIWHAESKNQLQK